MQQGVPATIAPSLNRWVIPGMDQAPATDLAAVAGQVTIFVGANGSGKSALGYWLQQHRQLPNRVERLIAHRRLWLAGATTTMSANARYQFDRNMEGWEVDPASRVVDHGAANRPDANLYDLVRLQHERDAAAAVRYDAGRSNVDEEEDGALDPGPIARINRVLASGNLPITITLVRGDTLHVRNARRDAEYPVSQMSDGEKAALLLVTEVLTKPTGCVQIVDEPERHLHRSISAPLIAAAMAERPDCHFILLTHDLDLAHLRASTSKTFVVVDAEWKDDIAVGWEIHEVPDAENISDTARHALLGGRTRVLLVEGPRTSLDSKLYRILFADWNAIAGEGCENVIRSVTGLHASSAQHWVAARGIVDADGRDPAEITTLAGKGILVLPVHEVESLYLAPRVLEAVAAWQAAALSKDPGELLADARRVALETLSRPHVAAAQAKSVTMAQLRRLVVAQADEFAGSGDITQPTVAIQITLPYRDLLKTFEAAIAAGDLDKLIKLFPVRDADLFKKVARALHFQNAEDFQACARTRIRDNAELATHVRDLVGPLPSPR